MVPHSEATPGPPLPGRHLTAKPNSTSKLRAATFTCTVNYRELNMLHPRERLITTHARSCHIDSELSAGPRKGSKARVTATTHHVAVYLWLLVDISEMPPPESLAALLKRRRHGGVVRQELCAGVDAGKSDPHCVVRGIDGLQRPTNACGPINTEHMTTGVLQRPSGPPPRPLDWVGTAETHTRVVGCVNRLRWPPSARSTNRRGDHSPAASTRASGGAAIALGSAGEGSQSAAAERPAFVAQIRAAIRPGAVRTGPCRSSAARDSRCRMLDECDDAAGHESCGPHRRTRPGHLADLDEPMRVAISTRRTARVAVTSNVPVGISHL